MVRRIPGLAFLVELVHGKVSDPQEAVVVGTAFLLEQAVLVRVLLCEFQAQRAHALGDPLPVVVPHGGRTELRRDDNGEVVRGKAVAVEGDGGRVQVAADFFRQRPELVGCAQACEVEDVEAAFAEEGADLRQKRLARGAAEFAHLRDDEAVGRQFLLDLQGGAQFGR